MKKEYTYMCLECLTREFDGCPQGEGGLCAKCGADNFVQLKKNGDIDLKDLKNFPDTTFIEVEGGVAHVFHKPKGTETHIIDWDTVEAQEREQ